MTLATKVIVLESIEFPVIALGLFLPAGTIAWTAGWVFLGLLFVTGVPMTWWLLKYNRGLIEERMRFRPEFFWDKIFAGATLVFTLLWLVAMPLDAVRFHWSSVPAAIQTCGAAVQLISLFISYAAMLKNPYASGVVKVQKDRGHSVVSTGPYRYVRHPMYTGACLFFPGMALLLGSWLGVLCTPVFAGLLAFRAVREERVLMEELDGYTAYMGKVKYRFFPMVW
ncbi:MAG: isoprenylcysteine carboxylmethyltransferase family protein [Syntrophobacteraceae bacterium]|nr:isoprenylcysteine carboxylmethyltransferase family protein [Syntrophobacteraceae bacterium]